MDADPCLRLSAACALKMSARIEICRPIFFSGPGSVSIAIVISDAGSAPVLRLLFAPHQLGELVGFGAGLAPDKGLPVRTLTGARHILHTPAVVISGALRRAPALPALGL